jgi:hypothetical protein
LVAASPAGFGCDGDGDEPPTRQEARRCLEDLGIHVTVDRLPGGGGAPDWELVANDILLGRVMLYVQYHDGEDEARRYEPGLRREARRQGWFAEREDALTLLWREGHGKRVGRRARECIV